MKNDTNERIVKVETRIDGHDVEIKAIKAHLKEHDLALHKHGRELQGITTATDAMHEAVDALKGVVSELPSKISEAVEPIRIVADNNKRDFERWKNLFRGGAIAVGIMGVLVISLLGFIGYLLKQLLGL